MGAASIAYASVVTLHVPIANRAELTNAARILPPVNDVFLIQSRSQFTRYSYAHDDSVA
jgi:hypothetical protein